MWTYPYSCPANVRQIFSKFWQKRTYILTPPPPHPPTPPPHTHTLSPWDLVISRTQSEIIFRHHPIKTEAPCQCWKLPESDFMYFTAWTFNIIPSIFDLVLTIILYKVSQSFFYLFLVFVTLPKCPRGRWQYKKIDRYYPLPKKRPCGKASGDLAASLLLLCRRPTARLRQCVFTMQMNLAAGLL